MENRDSIFNDKFGIEQIDDAEIRNELNATGNAGRIFYQRDMFERYQMKCIRRLYERKIEQYLYGVFYGL